MTKKISFFLLLLPNLLWANISATINPVPGGIAEITFESNHINPKGFYGSIPLYIQALEGNQHQALIGLPLMTRPGSKRITLLNAHINHSFIMVSDQIYADEHFEASIGQSNVGIIGERVQSERALFTKARKTFSAQALSKGYFILPTNGRITSAFGINRYYNIKLVIIKR